MGKLRDSILEGMPGALEELIGRINESAAAAADDYGKITCHRRWKHGGGHLHCPKDGDPERCLLACFRRLLGHRLRNYKQYSSVISSDGKLIKDGMVKLSPTETDTNEFFLALHPGFR